MASIKNAMHRKITSGGRENKIVARKEQLKMMQVVSVKVNKSKR